MIAKVKLMTREIESGSEEETDGVYLKQLVYDILVYVCVDDSLSQ
jgi:hypothetical protein